MMSDEIARLLSLEEELDKRVIGQNVAKQELAKAIRISRAGLTDSRKPIGVFLMCGQVVSVKLKQRWPLRSSCTEVATI